MPALDNGAALVAGLTLGLSSAGLCFWSCAAVMGPFLLGTTAPPEDASRTSSIPQIVRTLAWYHLGRVVAYALTALVVAGLAGLQAHLTQHLQASLRLIAAGIVAWATLRSPSKHGCAIPKRRATGAFVLGIAQGFSPCPPFLAALALGLASKPPATLLLFGGLFAVTTLFTLPLTLLDPLRRRPWLRHAIRVGGALICVYLIIGAVVLFSSP